MAATDSIARIINQQWPLIEQRFNKYQLRIFDAIRRCRTPSMGGHLYRCDKCKVQHYRYNSCRNRHCPRCQNTQKQQWIEARQEQFIECHYYHLVFTLPHQLNEICLAYPRQLYAMLLQVAWQTIDSFGWNHKYLGAQIGASLVLHTWGSNLSFHPHVHCIVPAGGLKSNGQWKQSKSKGDFLFHVVAMSILYRGKLLEGIHQLYKSDQLKMTDQIRADYKFTKNKLYKMDWVV